MADKIIEIDVVTKEIDDLSKRIAQKGADASPVTREIAAIMHEAVDQNFEKEGRPAWPPLKPSTIKRREKAGTWPGHVLRTGGQAGLQASVSEKSDATSAEVGTNKVYAGTHQFGARKGKYGRTKRGAPIPWGDIPARPFLKLTDEDEEDIKDALQKFLDKL